MNVKNQHGTKTKKSTRGKSILVKYPKTQWRPLEEIPGIQYSGRLWLLYENSQVEDTSERHIFEYDNSKRLASIDQLRSEGVVLWAFCETPIVYEGKL
jgi:hypothetical protein